MRLEVPDLKNNRGLKRNRGLKYCYCIICGISELKELESSTTFQDIDPEIIEMMGRYDRIHKILKHIFQSILDFVGIK